MANETRTPRSTSAGGRMDLLWVVAVVAIVVGITCVLIFAPGATIEKLFRLLEKLPVSAWAGIGTALSGALIAIWRSRTGGGGAALALLGVLVLGGTLVGCGPAETRVQATLVTAAADTTATAAEVIHAAVDADVRRSCPDTPDDDADRACVETLRARWTPADVAIASITAGLTTWLGEVEVAHATRNGTLLRSATRAVARLVEQYERLREVLAPIGAELPALPDSVIAIARAVAGQEV